MRNTTIITSAVLTVLGAGIAAAGDLGSSSYEAGVSLLMPENTGFMYTAQVDAQGLGAGTSAISTTDAYLTLTGFASSDGAALGDQALASAGSGVYSDFGFDRTVTTNATSSGQGRVVSTGEAIGSIGGVGSAYGSSDQQSILTVEGVTTVTNSNASSESAASLVGGARTSLVAGVVGTSDTFVGDTGTQVSDSQYGAAVAGVLALGDGTTIDITADDSPDYADLTLASGAGVVGITGQWSSPALDLSVRNAGGGTVSLGAETGGFFTGGISTLGAAGFNQATD